MLLFLLLFFFVIGPAVAFVLVKFCDLDLVDLLENSLTFCFSVLIPTLLVSLLVSGCVCSVDDNIIENREEVKILSAVDVSQTECGFFLGTGKVKDELKFFSYIQDEEGYIVPFEYPDDTKIKFTDKEPYIEKIDYKIKPSLKWWFFDLTPEDDYIIYIPQGSIVSEYVFDLR